MNRISTIAAIGTAGAIGVAALTTGCSGSSGKSPSATAATSSTTSATSTSTSTPESPGGTSQPATSTAAPSTTTSTQSTQSTPGTPSSPASSPAAPPAHADAVKCTAADMPGGTWKVVPASEGAGHVAADISLQNTSGRSCTVAGYPAIQQLASDGHPLPTTVVRVPTSVSTLTVAPGGWIHSEIRYSPNVPGEGEPTTGDCEPETVHAQAQLPGDSTWVKITLAQPTTVCEKGSLQAKPFAAGQSSPAGG